MMSTDRLDWWKALPVVFAARFTCIDDHKGAHFHLRILVGNTMLSPNKKLSTEGIIAGEMNCKVFEN